jgi:hypothetical protein
MQGQDKVKEASMFGALRGANGRRYEVDFGDEAVVVDVSVGSSAIQITMTEADASDLSRNKYVTIAVPRTALMAALAKAVANEKDGSQRGPRLVVEE